MPGPPTRYGSWSGRRELDQRDVTVRSVKKPARGHGERLRRHHPGRAAPQGVHPAHDRFQRVDPVATCERGIQDAARVIFQAGSHHQFVTSLSSLRPRSTLSSCLTIRPSAIPSVKSRPRGCARKSLARKLQAAEKPVFSTATAAARRGSRRRPAFRRAKRSASHRQQMEAERCATVNTSDLHYIFLIH